MLAKLLIILLTATVVSSLPATSQRWLRVSYDPHRADLWSVASTPTGAFIAVGDNGTVQRAVGTDSMIPIRGSRYEDHLRDVVYSSVHGLVAAGDGPNLLVSTDDGITWSSFQSGVDSVRRIAIAPNGDILLGSQRGLFRSSSLSGPWLRVDTVSNVTAVYAADNTTWLVATRDSRIYRTSNNFGSLDTTLTIAPYQGNIFTGRGDTVMVAFRNRLARSSDKGRTWRIAEVATGGSEITGAAFTRDGRTAIAVDDGAGGPGISLDTSMIVWVSQLGNPYVTSVAVSDTAVRWVCTDGAYIARSLRHVRSRDSAYALTQHLVQRGSFDVWVDIDENRRDTLLAYSNYGPTALRRSIDSGRTWKQLHFVSSVRYIPPNGIDTIVNITSVLRRPNGTALIAFDSVLYRSSQEISRTSFISELGTDDVFRKITTVNETVRWLVGMSDSAIAAVGRGTFFVSLDGGNTWTKRKAPSADTIYSAGALGNVWVLGGTSVHTSSNHGTTWIKQGLSPDKYGTFTTHNNNIVFLRTIRISFSNRGLSILQSADTGRSWSTMHTDSGATIYYGNDISISANGVGVFSANETNVGLTTDGGHTWTMERLNGIRSEVGLRTAYATTSGWVRVAGDFSEIFERYVGLPTSVPNDPTSASGTTQLPILRLYPNPSVGPITVECSVPMSSLSVFTLDGRELLTMPCTSTTATINSTHLPAGPLIIRVQFEGGVVSTRSSLRHQ